MTRFPAEWEPHARTWMCWPCRAEVWDDIAATKAAYVRVAEAIARFEPLAMIARPEDATEARSALGPGIEVVPIRIDDSWARDSGPTFLTGETGLTAACFTFNAWGGKYAPFDRDARLGAEIARRAGAEAATSWLIAEGGAITTDGEGTLITTESCLLNPNRNPGRTRDEITAELKRLLHVEKVIWLPGNPMETETDGHTDGIAVFAGPGKVLIESPVSDAMPDADHLRACAEALRGQTDAMGRPIVQVPLETHWEPRPGDAEFYTSYVNFYVVNGAVIAPAYGIDADTTAGATLQAAFPDREIVMLDIADITPGGGGIHCITQQEPRVA